VFFVCASQFWNRLLPTTGYRIEKGLAWLIRA
jgi:hypothetical protein